MIDVHTHILPGIDDGSSNVNETLAMIDEAYKAGFTDIITTSHYIDGTYDVNKKDRKTILDSLENVIDKKIQLHNGAEAYVSPDLVQLYNKQIIPTLAESRYALFELPLNSEVLYLNSVIRQFLSYDYIPVIAHPERYKCVKKNINKAYEFVEMGAVLQCNYGSFIGKYGYDAKKTAIKLLKNDKISFLGTDTHAPSSIYTYVEEAIAKIKKYSSYEKVEELTIYNPQKILNNEYL